MTSIIHIDIAIIVSLAVAIAYFNHRFIRLHTTIAVMASSLLISIVILAISIPGFSSVRHSLATFVNDFHFRYVLMHFMLGFLLFAGVLNIDVSLVHERKWEIGLLAIGGTIISTFLIGSLLYGVLLLLHIDLTYPQCLLFGALISPTDPVAVLTIFKNIHSLKPLATTLSAESLYNDGIGVVLFVTIYAVAFNGGHPGISGSILLFFKQAIGGLAAGVLLGALACWLMKSISDYKMKTLISIAIVIGGYTATQHTGLSGLLAMVTAGIIVGNYNRDEVMSAEERNYFNSFWEVVDELLNGVLFLMIGFEIVVIFASWKVVLAAVLMIPLVLLVRFIAVALPLSFVGFWRRHVPFMLSILTWGGLRGGLAVALALSLPTGGMRNVILPLTYAVVLFAVLVQGLTIKPLIEKADRLSRRSLSGS